MSGQRGRLPDKPVVTFDDREFRLAVPDGRRFTMSWQELQIVAVQTTDEGPFAENVFWVLASKEQSLRVPQGAEGAEDLLAKLQQLPGFKNDAVIEAMKCTDNKIFICWDRENTTA